MIYPRVVLVEPAGALNVGAVARVMKNMGLDQLVLVKPQCDPQAPEARQMAVHGQALLDNAQVYGDLPSALQGIRRIIATTNRPRTLTMPLERPEVALSWLKGEASALLFGPEDRGLSNQELSYAQRLVCIPSHPDYSSLNLAQAVAICAYELYREDSPPAPAVPVRQLACQEELEGYFHHLEQLLGQIGYLHPHTAASRMAKLRQIYLRAALSSAEVALIRGVLTQTEWAIREAASATAGSKDDQDH